MLGNNKKLLDKAMKEGYVTAKWTKFSISGAPETGKSSFLNLLFNEDPPGCHNSTSVIAAREARIISATVNDDSVWRKIDHESLKKLIAQGVKHSIRPLKPDVVENPGSSERKPINPSLEESVDHPTDQPKETSDSGDFESSTVAGYDQTFNQSSLSKLTITQEIIDDLPKITKSEELYQSHWIYGVDTGGQAAFLDIAPALLRYHSVNILTHKLTERLNDKSKFFFSVQGRQIGEPKEKQITNLQLLEASFSSLSSVEYPKLPNIKATYVGGTMYIILGTFQDKMCWYSEKLRKKNSILGSTLKEYSEVLIKPNPTGKEIMFSVNTTARGTTEVNLAETIRKEICKHYIKAEIPIRWFLLQLELDKCKRPPKSKFIVGTKECIDIGESLGMKEEMVKAALMYYHDLTIFLYFPEVLPNVVFLHPQPLFDVLSDLISISFADTVKYLHRKHISLPSGAFDKLKKEGTFQEDLVTSEDSHLYKRFSSEFSPQNFLKLMTSLFIMAPLTDKRKYFLPTVLPTTTSFTKYKSVPYRFKQFIDPLILSWDMKPLPRGVFPALVVNLLCCNASLKFQLVCPSDSAPCYRNAITLHTDYGDILLVDGIYWIAIYSTDPLKRCSALCEPVFNGICEVISKFHYKAEPNNLKKYFYCKMCAYKCSEHFCIVNNDHKTVTCCDSRKTMSFNKSRQQPWFCEKGEV